MAAVTAAYHPSEEDATHFWYNQREALGPEAASVTAAVPEGFPLCLDSPLAWTSTQVQNHMADQILVLSDRDVKDLEAAVTTFEAQFLELSSISAETFTLPARLVSRLRNISDICYKGVGFAIVHGLDPTRYTPEQNVILFAGIAAHVAPQRGFLDRKFEKVLCHVVNAAGKESDEKTSKSPGFTKGPLSFHSDGCEILGLYAMNIAKTGGRTLITSSWQLYNDLASKRPDILSILADDWILDTFRDHTRYPPITQPFLHSLSPDDENKIVFRFSRYPVTGFAGAQRSTSLPAPTAAQHAALDAVHFMAAASAVALPVASGDLVFLNDMAILHARERFEEPADPARRRHLLKMYLRDPAQDWPVPPAERECWEAIYGANREGGRREEKWYVRYSPGQEDDWLRNG